MTTSAEYAEQVTAVLRDHFPGVADPVVAQVITEAVRKQADNPQMPFEVIVDDPISANWRLKSWGRDRRRVRLRCFRFPDHRREADTDLEERVNEALATLTEPKEASR